MTKKALLHVLCITPYISTYAMNPDTTISLSPQTIKQLHYNYQKWQLLTHTSEFITCAELLKKSPTLSSSEYNTALKVLHKTKEFKKYKTCTCALGES